MAQIGKEPLHLGTHAFLEQVSANITKLTVISHLVEAINLDELTKACTALKAFDCHTCSLKLHGMCL